MSIRGALLALSLFALPAASFAQAGGICDSDLMAATPVRPTMLAPVALELSPATTQLGGASGVLSQAFDEALSVDNVLLRIRQDGCRAMASARPAGSVVDPNNPAAYKPKTEFDNTPWRFNMTQDGKRMTADEFDAWMKSRGVRVAKGNAAPTQPAASEPAPAPTTPSTK
ncbi:MAG: hypothetical protein EOP93_10805 [Lysobacteraceae bacterium]|nr:MAG: hypothetical protein EOP93_10805 [Xanthomonadaceae bacterium]